VTVPTGGAEGTGGGTAAAGLSRGGETNTVAGDEEVTGAGTGKADGSTGGGTDGGVDPSGWLVVTPTGGKGLGWTAGANTGGDANVGPADMPGP
jgi:hypothetical protein